MVDTSGGMSIRAGGTICKVSENGVDTILAPEDKRMGDMIRK